MIKVRRKLAILNFNILKTTGQKNFKFIEYVC